MITWYRCGQSTFYLCGHVGGQRKDKNWQKHHRTIAPKDKNQGGQNPQKMKIFYYSRNQGVRYPISHHMIQVWTINILVMRSRHVGRQRKAKMNKSTILQQHQRIKIKADKTPKRWKYFTTPTIKVCDIPSLVMWSHDTDVDNQHSRHAVTWADREKPKWTNAI